MSLSIFSHGDPSKGVDGMCFAVACLVQDMLWVGFTKVMLKYENEQAMFKLMYEPLRDPWVNGVEQVMSENPLEYE